MDILSKKYKQVIYVGTLYDVIKIDKEAKEIELRSVASKNLMIKCSIDSPLLKECDEPNSVHSTGQDKTIPNSKTTD